MKALRPPLADAALAAALLVLAQVETWTGGYARPALVSLLALVGTAPLAWRQRLPLVALSLVIASLLGLAALGQSDDPVWLFAVLLVASYSAGANADRVRALAGLALLLAFIAVAFALEPERGAGDFLFIAIVFGGAWLLAQMLRLHRSRANELELRTVRLAPAEKLIEAVRVVAAGEALLAPTVARRVIERFATLPAPRPDLAATLDELTERELEVLRLVARGFSNPEIARELVVSEHTAKTHVGHILRKLDLRDRIQAVILAYESGLVRPGSMQS